MQNKHVCLFNDPAGLSDLLRLHPNPYSISLPYLPLHVGGSKPSRESRSSAPGCNSRSSLIFKEALVRRISAGPQLLSNVLAQYNGRTYAGTFKVEHAKQTTLFVAPLWSILPCLDPFHNLTTLPLLMEGSCPGLTQRLSDAGKPVRGSCTLA